MPKEGLLSSFSPSTPSFDNVGSQGALHRYPQYCISARNLFRRVISKSPLSREPYIIGVGYRDFPKGGYCFGFISRFTNSIPVVRGALTHSCHAWGTCSKLAKACVDFGKVRERKAWEKADNATRVGWWERPKPKANVRARNINEPDIGFLPERVYCTQISTLYASLSFLSQSISCT